MWDSQFLHRSVFYADIFEWAEERISQHYSWPCAKDYNNWRPSAPVNFIEQTDEPISSFMDGYEPRIRFRQEVPTRHESWHDLFNALVWMSLPLTKKKINELQCNELCKRAISGDKKRTNVENKLTHFDECGAVMLCSCEEMLGLLVEHQWDLFFKKMYESNKAKLYVVGHATYESLLSPYVGLTTKTILIRTDAINVSAVELDRLLVNIINDNIHYKDLLAPMPILGIPGAFADNVNASFYHNNSYFRTKPRASGYRVFSPVLRA